MEDFGRERPLKVSDEMASAVANFERGVAAAIPQIIVLARAFEEAHNRALAHFEEALRRHRDGRSEG